MNKIIRFLFIILMLFVNLVPTDLFGQGQANVWYFGAGNGLNFNTNPPTSMEDGNLLLKLDTGGGVGSVSDTDGNLLFYTNGGSVFNKNHVVMPNGNATLNTINNTLQSALIIPVPGSTTRFYIISIEELGADARYSIVNMSLDGGLGNVEVASLAGTNGTLLLSSAGEGSMSVPQFDAGNMPTGNYWLILHSSNSDPGKYYVFEVNATGIVPNPVVPANAVQTTGYNAHDAPLSMKSNSCFDKIATAYYNRGVAEVLPFNNITGAIGAAELTLSGTGAGNTFLNPEVYGIEFSPNGRYIYISEGGLNDRKTVYQFDRSLGTGTNPAAVIASKRFYTAGTEINRVGALQMGPDGKIYFPGGNFAAPTYVNVIPTPNTQWSNPPVLGTDIEYLKYLYTARVMGEGLPTISKDLLTQIRIFYNNACEGGTTTFSYVFAGSVATFAWNFGDPGSGLLNTSSSSAPSHVYSAAGTYTVTLTVVDDCGRQRVGTVDVIVKPGPTVSVPASYCPGNVLITGTGTNAANYTWSLSASMTSPSGPSSTYTYTGSLPATVYVKDPTPLATYTTGNTTASENFGADLGHTYFELFTSVELKSFQAISRGATAVTVSIQNDAGTTTYWTSNIASTGVSGTVNTRNPNLVLGPGKYRIFTGFVDAFFRNNTAPNDGGRDVNGVIDVQGEKNGAKGGSFINIVIELPDPCGVRAINLVDNLCCTPPSFTSPSSIPRCEGVAASFTASTTGSSPTYQWQVSTNGGVSWVDISGAISATYTIPAGSVLYALNNNQYRAFITASSCPFPTSAATLTITKPVVTSASLGTICNGVPQSYDITSDIPSTFTWSRAAVANVSNAALSGQTSDPITESLFNTSTSPVNVVYSITPISTTGSCSGFPSTYTVTVNPGPDYTLPATICAGSVTITGVGPQATNYTWATSVSGPFGSIGSTYNYTGALPSTVYVKYPSTTYTVGNTDATAHHNSNDGDTRFDLFTSVTLTSFQVRARQASMSGTLTLQKWNGTAWANTTGSEAWSSAYTTGVINSLSTFTPNVTLSIGTYRLNPSNADHLWKNNTSRDGGRNVSGVVTVNGDTDTGVNSKGGAFFNLSFAIPDPCGVRAINLVSNCCVPPTITTHPSSITRCVGVAASFTVATSAASPTYQWQVSTNSGSTWTDIGGETSATYSITAGSVTSSINGYQYRAVVTSASCFANSNAATLTVSPVANVTNTPLTATVCEGTAWTGLTLTADVSSTFAWTSSASGGITGNTASGTGNLPSQTFANSNTTAGTVTYAITPTANSCPGLLSNYVVTVNPRPVVTNTPLTATACEGTSWAGLTITADVAGTTFGWTSTASAGITGNTASGTGNLPSQTFVNSVTTAGTVTYSITPTANTCSSTPTDYIVTVNPVPVITNTPLTASVCEGTSWTGLTITSDVTGTTYAWTSTASAGITGNTASGTGNLPSQTFANSGSTAGTVTYVITPTANSCPGTAVNYIVTVNPAPVVTNSPLTTAVCENTLWPGLTITSDVTGTTFAWTSSVSAGITGNTASGTGNLPSQTFANSLSTPETVTYTITPTAATCIGGVSNYAVTVNPTPGITNTPLTASSCSGAAWAGFALTADVTGTTYAWTSSASAGIGGNTASGTGNLPGQTFTNSGTTPGTVTYSITPTANTCPGTSVNYIVTVNPATIITAQPTATTTLCVGAALNLGVTATGTTLTYQWNLGGSPIAGATNSTYTVASAALADAGTYTVTVTGTCGIVTSNNAVVNVNGVVINTQPANQGPCVGGSATFTVATSGPGLTYQWQENTGGGFVNIGGATTASYNIPVVGAGMDGYTYQVIIQSNGLCEVTSTIATLTVNTNTTINTHPASAGLCVGNAMTLTVNASGSGMMTYQWRKGGILIPGEISDTYSIASLISTDGGSYTVDVSSSGCGSASSNAAVITINNVNITTEPDDQIICEGDNHTFSVTAAGLGTLSYQWQSYNGIGTFVDIGGQTSSTLNITGAALTLDGYQYRVEIRDDNRCLATSAAAILSVNPLTVINTPPSAANLCVGNALNLSVAATGSGVLGYQWNLDGNPIGSATSATYNVGSVTVANAGSYTVDISGGCSNISSTAVLVTVNGVTITADPVDEIICEGNDHTFAVTATGLGTLTYQWQTDNGTGTFVNILGATFSSYTVINPSQTISGYKYLVIVKDDNRCDEPSAIATLTVNPATSITNAPIGSNLCVGNPLALSVTATGSGVLTYQWNLNGAPILGATIATYDVIAVTSADAGSYTVDVTGNCTIFSTSAAVTVNEVTISADPTNQPICEGTDHTFSVTASGLGTISYQWQTDNGTGTFANIPGETNSTLTLTAASLALNGYKYRVTLKDDDKCSIPSAAAILTVNPSTAITSHPAGDNLCVGEILDISVFASGTGVLGYQWNLDGAPIGSATSSSYNVPTVVGADAGSYTVTVTGSCGPSVTSNAALVVVNGVTITADPITTTICEGTDATFSVTASGLGTLSYQWQTDNKTGIFVNMSETSASLTLPAVSQTLDDYQYQVIIRDDNTCSSISAIGTLIVNPATIINAPPAGATVCDGDPLNLEVTATGDIPLTYQWQLNGTDIIGASSSTYSIAATTSANAGSYTVVVTSGSVLCADVTSNAAAIVVTPAPLTNLSVTGTSNICEGTNATVTIFNSEPGVPYQAFIGTTLVSSGTGNGINLDLDVSSSSLSIGSNTITIDALGCRTVTLINTATVVVLQSPVADAGSDIQVSTIQQVTLDGSGSSTGATYGYTWTSADPGAIINTPNAISTLVTPQLMSADYYLLVYLVSNPSCQATDVVKVSIDFKVKVPNVFSPNGDGKHDVLYVQNIEYFPNSIMYIYNQWGELIYKSAPGYTMPWDGTRGGQAVPVSAYYYVLELNERDYKSLSGDVTIIR